MRGKPVDSDAVGHPENLLLKVTFELGSSITGGQPATLSEIKALVEKELANVKEDRFLKLALTFIVDEIQYTLESSNQADAFYPQSVSASWDRCAPDATTRVYYPLFDEPTEIVV